jgi:hypothetical protein
MNDATEQLAPLHDTSRHLSVEETAALFADAGVPKSIRTIQRYCKSGILESIRTDTEFGDKYLIDRPSADRRIDELTKFQEMMATAPTSRLDTSRLDASYHGVTRSGATRHDSPDESQMNRVKELEAEVLNLKIDNRAKEIVITQLAEERRGFFSQITEQATRIGELSTKLRQLIAPVTRESHGSGLLGKDERAPVDDTGDHGDNPLHEKSGSGVEL